MAGSNVVIQARGDKVAMLGSVWLVVKVHAVVIAVADATRKDGAAAGSPQYVAVRFQQYRVWCSGKSIARRGQRVYIHFFLQTRIGDAGGVSCAGRAVREIPVDRVLGKNLTRI